jgi:hypothetical protein
VLLVCHNPSQEIQDHLAQVSRPNLSMNAPLCLRLAADSFAFRSPLRLLAST